MRHFRRSIARVVVGLVVAVLAVLAVMPSSALADERWVNDEHTWKRVWGENAYDTMEAVINVQDSYCFPDGSVDSVIVATGDGYWDALAAAGAAGVLDCPILVTPKNSLCEQTRRELKRLSPHHVILAGGPMAVSDEVEAEIKKTLDIPAGSNIRRYGDRASDTAVALFKSVDPLQWNKGNLHDFCIVATTNGYWDALSVAPLAYAYHIPIFLADYDANDGGYILSKNTLEAMKLGDFDYVIIVGGEMAVSSTVITQVKQIEHEGKPISVERWCGQTAIDTSQVIARMEIDYFNMSVGNMMVATSNGYWDALTAAPVAGKLNSVVVLMDPLAMHHQAFDEVFAKDEVGIGYILGGQFALSEAAEGYVYGKAKGLIP